MSGISVVGKANLLGLLFEQAAVGDLGRVRRRVDDAVFETMLGGKQPGPTLRRLATRDPDPWVRRVVARNTKALTVADLEALLDLPDPIVDRLVYAHPAALPWMRRVVLAPGRHPRDPQAPHPLAALHDEILARTDEPAALAHCVGAAVGCDLPELVTHALRTCGETLTTAEQLRGLLSLRRFGDADAVAAALPFVRPESAEAAAGDLPAAVEAAEGIAGLVTELRSHPPRPIRRRTLDWSGLLAAHRADPLPEHAAAVLAARPDCPDDLVVALYEAHPAAVGPIARPCLGVLRAALETPKHPALAKIAALTRALAEPADLDRVAAEVTPARTAVAALVELPPGRTPRELLHRHLGAHPDRWAALRTALPKHRGTLSSLLAAIADGGITATSDKPGSPPPTLTKPYRFLLAAADPDDLRDLLPGLPDPLVRDLLSGGPLPTAAFHAAIDSADPRAWTAVARNVGLDIRDLARLVAKRVPAVNAAVYRNIRATPSLRRTIAAREPFDPELRAELLRNADPRLLRTADRRTLAPLLVSGDPELVACALRFGCRKTAQQYAYVRVWERHGADAVRTLLEISGSDTTTQIRNRIEAALAAGAGPAELRANGEPYEDPATLPKLFQTRTSRTTVRDLVHEPYAHDFPLLMAAHRESPFATEAIDDLIRHEDATDEDRTSLRLAMVNAFRGHHRTAVDIDPARWLRTENFGRAGSWAAEAVAQDLLDPALLVDVAYPARDVVAAGDQFDQVTVLTPMRARLAELTRDHLAGHTEAFAIAVGLIDTFEASLAELITVAAQAAGPRPDPEQLARDDAAALEAARHEAESATAEPIAAPPATAKPRTRDKTRLDERTKLSATHFLRVVAESAGSTTGAPVEIPVPADPAVLASLVDVWVGDSPGFEYPSWVYQACFASASTTPRAALARRVFDEVVANDLIDLGEPKVLAALADNGDLVEVTAKRLAAVRTGTPTPRPDEYPPSNQWPTPSPASSFLRWTGEFFRAKSTGDGMAEATYRHGILGPTELLDALPTSALTPLPGRWRNRIVGGRIQAAAEALVAERLGTDLDLWLRALVAMDTGARSTPLPAFLSHVVESAASAEASAESEPPTWDAVASAERITFDPIRGFGRTPYRWKWPAGELLLLAGPPALAVLLPALGPDAFATLWAFANFCRYHREQEPNALVDHAFAATDRAALHVVAWADPTHDVRTRILCLDDPALNATLYRSSGLTCDTRCRRAILSRIPRGRTAEGPDDLVAWDPALRDFLLHGARVSTDSLPELRLRVEAADAEVIVHALETLERKATLTEQLVAIRGLLRYGGADRITGLVERGLLGATAARVVVKALEQADPDAVLTQRIDRERGPDKLLAKLRRCTHGHETETLLAAGHTRDWDLLVAEHVREPFPIGVWDRVAGQPDAPARALETEPLHEWVARKAASRSRAHARTAVAHGRDALGDVDWYLLVDRTVEAGLLTGRDLVHRARGAGTVLNWVAEAVQRIGVPDAIRIAGIEAAEEIAALAGAHLGIEQAAWDRVFAALAGCDPSWDREAPGSTIATLLTR